MNRLVLENVIRKLLPPFFIDLVGKARWRFDPEWHRQRSGGLWDEMGKLQFDFLVAEGLKPEHKLLDIGCGCLRGGIHFIKYLASGNYFGVEKEKRRLDAALRFELPKEMSAQKNPKMVHMENFDFASLGAKFDFALAQSLFSHLPLNPIIRCLLSVEKVLQPAGRFYATFFESPGPKFNLNPVVQRQGEPETYFDQNPFHYNREVFEWICQGTSLEAKYMGDWGHPRGQKMMAFIKK